MNEIEDTNENIDENPENNDGLQEDDQIQEDAKETGEENKEIQQEDTLEGEDEGAQEEKNNIGDFEDAALLEEEQKDVLEDEEVLQEESVFLTESEANLQFLLMSEPTVEGAESVETLGVQQPNGMVCTVHFADSKSNLREHPYFYLQYVKDPGIIRALYRQAPEFIYDDDGQDVYEFMCEVMGSCFLKKFHHELLSEAIEFKWYGINSSWMRAMCQALWNNRTVTTFNLSKNYLSMDACFHIGELLKKNGTITEINLSGCHIQMEGVRRLVQAFQTNKIMKIINLENNELKDEGFRVLAPIFYNNSIQQLNISHNKFNFTSGFLFGKNVTVKNCMLTHIDFSWNSLRNKGAIYVLKALRKIRTLTWINLSWNGISNDEETADLVGKLIKSNKKLEFIDISHNLLGDSLVIMSEYFRDCPHIVHCKIGSNQITPDGALMIIYNFTNDYIKTKILDMEETNVTRQFAEVCENIKSIRSRRNTQIIYNTVLNNYILKGPDIKLVAFRRAQFLATKKKKSFGSFILRSLIQLQGGRWMNDQTFASMMKKEKLGLDKDLMGIVVRPFIKKKKGLNVKAMAEFVEEMWPDCTPLDDQPIPIVVEKPVEEVVEEKGKKGKKGKKEKQKKGDKKKK